MGLRLIWEASLNDIMYLQCVVIGQADIQRTRSLALVLTDKTPSLPLFSQLVLLVLTSKGMPRKEVSFRNCAYKYHPRPRCFPHFVPFPALGRGDSFWIETRSKSLGNANIVRTLR